MWYILLGFLLEELASRFGIAPCFVNEMAVDVGGLGDAHSSDGGPSAEGTFAFRRDDGVLGGDCCLAKAKH